ELDHAIWAENLAALGREQPDVANAVAGIELPQHWRAVRTLDGAAGFRIETAGCAAEWLGGSAVPLTRAAGLFGDALVRQGNLAVPIAGSGAELCWLLERMLRQRALFVLDDDPLASAAAMRLYSFECDIAAGRLLFILGDNPAARLIELLAAQVGLLP